MLRWAAFTLGGLFALLLVLWGFLLTPVGLRLAAQVAENAAATPDMSFRIVGLSGVLPFSLRLDSFALSDKKGPWLLVSDARVSWSPLALLRGRVLIREVSADVVRVMRAPQTPPPPKEPEPLTWPPQFPSLPAILVDKLAVNRIILDKPLAGQDAVITLSGRLAESGRGAVGLSLAATRLDGDKPLALRVAGALNYAAWKLAIQASLDDAPGGLLAAAMAGPDGGPLAVSLSGDGPLTGWKGRLTGSLDHKEFLAADLGLAVPLEKDAMAAFSLDAALTPPAGILPADAARLVGGRPTCRLAGRFGIVSGEFFLDKADVAANAGTLAATAHLPADKGPLAATVTVTLPDAAKLDPSLAGTATVEATASGPMARPELDARITAAGFAAGGVTLRQTAITAKAVLAGDLDGPFPGATVHISGNLDGLSGPEGTTLLGDALTLALDASVDKNGVILARTGGLTGKGGGLTLTGIRVDNGKISGDAALRVADVAGAAALGGLHLTGGLEARAALAADAAGAGKATVDLRLAGFGAQKTAARDTASEALAALLGGAPKIALKADFSPKGATLRDLTLDGKALTLAASGALDTAAGSLSGKTKLRIPDLAVLEPALGQKSAGAVVLDVDLSGKTVSPKVKANITADKLVLGQLALAGLTLDATADDLAKAPAGTVALTARREGETASLETGFALAGNRLSIKNLRINAPQAAFSGEATVDLPTSRVTGTLSGNAADLAGLGRFVGQPLGGGLRLSVTAKDARGAQGVTCDLSGTNLRLPGVTADRLNVTARLADASAAPKGQATVTGSGIVAGDTTLTELSVAATGDGKTLGATVTAKGTAPGDKPLSVSAKAALATTAKGRRVTLSALSGDFDKRRFTLTRPTVLDLEGGSTRLDDLALTFDKAQIAATASLTPRGVAAKASITGVPLHLLAAFGVTGVGGTASLTATLSGSAARPDLKAEASVKGLTLAAEKSKGLPTLSVETQVAVSGGKASVTTTVSPTGKKKAITVEAAVPVRFALEPFAFDVAQTAPLSGRVEADSDLSQMAALLAQANTRITGRLTADMALGGTLAAPTVTGDLALAAKSVENADAGLVLRDMTLQARAANGVLAITKAEGRDNHGGSFTLSGNVGMADLVNGPVNLALKLVHLRVAGLDLATVTADGKIDVSGTMSQMRASGDIELGPAEINLPTSMPPDVTVIPVTLVNDPNAPKKPTKKAPPEAARHIDLNLTVSLGQAVYVRGPGLESRWGGKITITGTAATPRIVGKYYVEEGRVELFGSNLAISKGDVVFHGGWPPSPVLDILAENSSNDVSAGVSITGDATNPTIKLVSTPPMAHNEILSRILFGQSAAELSPLQAAQLAQAAASLYAGGSPTSILARTRRILGLDQLSLVSGKEGISSSVLKAGKEIVKGVTVGVEQGMGAQTGAVSVEVQVTPNITIDSRVGADNKQGVGVNWKWDY